MLLVNFYFWFQNIEEFISWLSQRWFLKATGKKEIRKGTMKN